MRLRAKHHAVIYVEGASTSKSSWRFSVHLENHQVLNFLSRTFNTNPRVILGVKYKPFQILRLTFWVVLEYRRSVCQVSKANFGGVMRARTVNEDTASSHYF